MSDLFINSLVGKNVRLDRGGPESREGRVLAVGDDFLALHHEQEGVIYYSLEHLKSLTVDFKSNNTAAQATVKSIRVNIKDNYLVAEPVESMYPEHMDAGTFQDVMKSMEQRYVQINRGGPEKIQGFLSSVNDDHILLVTNNEVVRILNYHIRNCSYGLVQENQNDNQQQNNNQSNNQSDNQSSKSSSSSKKSKK